MTWLQFKGLIGQQSTRESLEMGAICNSLNDPDCAKSAFLKVVAKNPQSRLALANLGIAMARLDECPEAMQTFDQYLALGSGHQDVYFWMARCQAQLRQSERALVNYYRALSLGSDNMEVGRSLIGFLQNLDRIEEAIAVIGALTGGRPSRSAQWREEFARLVADDQRKMREGMVAQKRALRVPSFDNRHYLIPVRFAPDLAFEFFEVDTEEPIVSIDEDQLLLVSFSMADQTRAPTSDASKIMRLKNLQVGPWLYNDVDFVVCRDCTSTLGQSLLTHFQVHEQIEGGVRFLILRPE